MNKKITTSLSTLLIIIILFLLNSCSDTLKEPAKTATPKTIFPSDITPFFNDWKLILGDGSNAGIANNFEQQDFFFSKNDGENNWVVYKAPNAGDTHGTSNNCRTELAQAKKWSPMTDAKLTATLKVMNVSATGDERVAASLVTKQ